MTYDVFISYASSDKPIAAQVCSTLESMGARCWIAPRDIPPGKPYGGAITEAISTSRIMVVIFSADANRSPQVVREVERAVHNGTVLIPLRVEEVKPTENMEYFLSMPQWLDAVTEPRAPVFQHLAETVQQILASAGASPKPVGQREVAPAITAVVREAAPVQPQGATSRPLQITLLYKRNAHQDEYVLKMLVKQLTARGHAVFFDDHLIIGGKWLLEIETKIRAADAVIALLSAEGVSSEMIAIEVEIAHQARQEQGGKPRLLPVRLNYEGPLPDQIMEILNPLEYKTWRTPQDDARLLAELERAFEAPEHPASQRFSPPLANTISPDLPMDMEPVGGPVPLGSRFYIERTTDAQFLMAVARQESIILLKGPRQIGKTSLLARGFQQARSAGAHVVLTDFQKLNKADFQSLDSLYMALSKLLIRQLKLNVSLPTLWDPNSTPNGNFEDFLIDHVFANIHGPIVWGLDEVDRLFDCDFGTDVFGLFRSWHNERHLDPGGHWARLSQMISYATEAHLFIADLNQSPFNVGLSIQLQDFSREQTAELNARYGHPLRSDADLTLIYDLLGGHPYLIRRGLYALKTGRMDIETFAAQADLDDGPFSDHLHRIVVILARSPDLVMALRELLAGRPCPSKESFFRLRSAGVIAGESAANARLRCRLYTTYLTRYL